MITAVHMQFFGGWVIAMTLFTVFFLPETKGVPLVSLVANHTVAATTVLITCTTTGGPMWV